MKEDTLLSITEELDIEERYLVLLTNEGKCLNTAKHQAIIDRAIADSIARVDSLREKRIKLHNEATAVVALVGLPTYKLHNIPKS